MRRGRLFERQGHSERVEYTAEFSGMFHVWTKVESELDLFLRLEECPVVTSTRW